MTKCKTDRENNALEAAVNEELCRLLLGGPRPSTPAKVCVRLFDASNALLRRVSCDCNTHDCPHRHAKDAQL